MVLRTVVVLLLAGGATGQVTQALRGTVVDAVTGQPLADVKLRLDGESRSSAANTAASTTSGANGAFVLPLPGPGLYTITGTRPGYLASHPGQTSPIAAPAWMPIGT